MPTDPGSELARGRRALGARLRHLRGDAGLTGRALADLSGVHFTRVSKIEHGRVTPTLDNLRGWCRACGAEEELPGPVAAMRSVEDAYVEWRTVVRQGMKGAARPGSLNHYARTKLFRIHEINVIPGILQTEEYARGVLDFWRGFHDIPDDVAEAASFRLRRAAHAMNPAKRVVVVLAENAIRTRYCAAHDEQLVALLAHLGKPYVSVVFFESPSAEIKVTRPAEVDISVRLFAHLQSLAVYGAAARRIITRALDALDRPFR
ncbi:transcriptional regulator [Pilimelia anulata]|uniref:Transcriptional regulator n=1 Tax=Pilimelia anulata TaxID=53371 RepID=A0A8J3B4N1_9ACTN|nr:Scr1 family TA system antitoxin-like transcriptional regulator [Pilimelia anulata]GGJ95372.1 transcriptional regulator [Pilimelia anulata]